jgi:hypothetical protein
LTAAAIAAAIVGGSAARVTALASSTASQPKLHRQRGGAGPVLGTVHNAIDWLAMRWNHGALHGKPLAVIGSGTLQRDLALMAFAAWVVKECGVDGAT